MQRSINRGSATVCTTALWTIFAAHGLAQVAAPGLPTIAGVRTGMTAQQAYDALRAHAPGVRISIGQNIVDGVTAKPAANLMTVKIEDKVPMELVTIWLTTPPSRQVVWAVAETLTYPEANKLPRQTALDALHKKFGAEASSQSGIYYYWSFDGNGSSATALSTASNCINAQNFTIQAVDSAEPTFTYVSPLIYPMAPKSPCDALTDVRAQFNGPSNAAQYVTTITVTEVDHALVRSTKEAYAAYMGNANARQRQQDSERAKQQSAPTF